MKKVNIAHILMLSFLALFVILPNSNQGNDSYSYAIDVRDGSELVHPHHLIYNILGYLLYQIFMFTGLGSMKILSLGNTLFGAAALLILYRILYNKNNRLNAVVGTLFTGLLFSFWYYSTSVEVNIPALMFLLLALYFLLKTNRSSRDTIFVYVFLSIGIMFHQILALFVIPVLIYDITISKSYKSSIKLSLPGLFFGILIYIIAAFIESSEKSLVGIYKWLTLYSHLNAWGTLGTANFTAGSWGLLKTFFGGDIVRNIFYGGRWSVIAVVYISTVAIFFLILATLMGFSIKRLIKNRDRKQIFLAALVLIPAVFAFWWAPADDGFWLYSVVMLFIFIFQADFNSFKYRKSIKHLSLAGLIILSVSNIIFEFIPSSNPENSAYIRGADTFNRLKLKPDDLVLTNYSQIRKAYNYHYNTYVPTTCVLYQQKGDKSEIIRSYRNRIDSTLATDRVIIFEDEIYPKPELYYMFVRFSPNEYIEIYKPYMERMAAVDSIMMHGKNVRLYEIEQ